MRRYLSKQSKQLARELMDNPEAVAFLFRVAAQTTLHEGGVAAGRKYADIGMTPYYGREVLKRRKPFDHPHLFSLVEASDAEKVASKFKGTVKPKAPAAPVRKKMNGESMDALHDVLVARVALNEALDAAERLGWDRETVKAITDLTAESMS